MKKKKERHHLKSAEISCFAPDAQEVSVGGTFNGWDPSRTPMSKSGDGTWRVVLRLPAGSYEYKFVVDGRWVCEPGVDEFDPKLVGSPDCVPNVFGSLNRKLDRLNVQCSNAVANANATAIMGLTMTNSWKCWPWTAVKPRRWILPVIFSLSSVLPAVSQSGNQRRPLVSAWEQLSAQFPQQKRQEQDEEFLRIQKENAGRANEQRQLELRRDTDRLLQLTNELKQYVDKTNENILSLEVIKKAEEIERLAKSVKVKMKGKD